MEQPLDPMGKWRQVGMLKKLKSLFKPATAADRRPKSAARYSLSPLVGAVFEMTSPVLQKIDLGNLSTTGFGLRVNLDRKWQQVGVVLSGNLMLNKKSVRLSCQVRHVTGLTVGCEFLARTNSLENEIQAFLTFEMLNLGLRKVNPELMKEPADWYVDGRGNELLIERNRAGELIRFHASFLSNWIEWKGRGDPKFGYTLPPETNQEKALVKPTAIVHLVEAPPPGIEYLFSRFLHGISQMSDAERREIMHKLSA